MAAAPRRTTSRTERSSLRSSARRSRPPFTRWATSIWPLATMNSGTRTTRSSRYQRKLHLYANPVGRRNPGCHHRPIVPFLSNRMKRLFHEPLLHFLLIGVALFAVFQLVRPTPKPTPSSKQIQLSLDDLTRLALLFQSQWKREPTAPELERLMETKIQTEILYREALAMGLDKDDEIVKRRMAQKMQFLAEDAAQREPTTAELKSWYAKNSDKFALPTRVSFRHLYFSPDRRAAHARDDAVKALAQLAGQTEDAKLPGSFADPFMFQEYYRDRGTDFLGKEFGPQFALAVAKL